MRGIEGPRRARARTWTLETLDPVQEYRLYFDREAWRWEVVDAAGGLVRTKAVKLR